MSVLNSPTLILNKSWHPIDSTIVRKAFGDVMSERAQFIDTPSYIPYDILGWMQLPIVHPNKSIQTSTCTIKLPEIMLLSKFNKIPKQIVKFNRRNLWRRDGCKCQYCGTEPSYDEITVDHIVPRSKGGSSNFQNCVLCCITCNLKKSDRRLEDTDMKLQKRTKLPNGKWTHVTYDRPKRPIWNPLYRLSRKKYPKSWAAFLKNFDETLYWEVQLESQKPQDKCIIISHAKSSD